MLGKGILGAPEGRTVFCLALNGGATEHKEKMVQDTLCFTSSGMFNIV